MSMCGHVTMTNTSEQESISTVSECFQGEKVDSVLQCHIGNKALVETGGDCICETSTEKCQYDPRGASSIPYDEEIVIDDKSDIDQANIIEQSLNQQIEIIEVADEVNPDSLTGRQESSTSDSSSSISPKSHCLTSDSSDDDCNCFYSSVPRKQNVPSENREQYVDSSRNSSELHTISLGVDRNGVYTQRVSCGNHTMTISGNLAIPKTRKTPVNGKLVEKRHVNSEVGSLCVGPGFHAQDKPSVINESLRETMFSVTFDGCRDFASGSRQNSSVICIDTILLGDGVYEGRVSYGNHIMTISGNLAVPKTRKTPLNRKLFEERHVNSEDLNAASTSCKDSEVSTSENKPEDP